MLQEDSQVMKKTKDHRIQEEKLQSVKAKETAKIRSLKLFQSSENGGCQHFRRQTPSEDGFF